MTLPHLNGFLLERSGPPAARYWGGCSMSGGNRSSRSVTLRIDTCGSTAQLAPGKEVHELDASEISEPLR